MQSERLIIDRLRESDRADYFENISHDKKVLETFVCTYAERLEDFDFSRYLSNESLFAIRLKQTGGLIGIILYFDEKDGACEIGYGIGSSHWGKGYGTEAVRRFLSWCFEERGLQRVYASFFTGNDASRRIMEKCGMCYHHFSEKELSYLGAERDLTYYVIQRSEWAQLALAEAEKAVLPGRYRHFKGREYQVIGIARHSETEAPLVVYRKCYDDGGLWVRPVEMWNETVEQDGKTLPRFRWISES
jgi:ribosomal-protein-alanine N-acetyltransferase